jgi:hypothetical protein
VGLKEITACLLESESNVDCLRAATELHATFSGIVKVNDEPGSNDLVETHLGNGKALSPVGAARCILDYMRTRSFLRGVRDAILESLQRFPGEIIHVLYAGCGPFATLALPLTTYFSSEQVQFTLLDIHQRSLDSARQIVESLGVSSYIRGYVRTDAAVYRDASASPPHIVLTETMQRCLENEPQVAITRNLVPTLREGGVLVPQKVTLTACLTDLRKEFDPIPSDNSNSNTARTERTRIGLGKLFELTAESARRPWRSSVTNSDEQALCSSPVRICIPEIPDDTYELMILTDITVLGTVVLSDYESGISYPTVLKDLGRIRSGDQLESQYFVGVKPGLRWKRV